MGSGEAAGTPTKAPKTSAAQEQPAAGAAATAAAAAAAAPFPPGPEWAAAAFQAYCSTPPPGYQPHPYMWGTQPMMPYGTGPYYPYMPPGPHAYSQYAGMPPPGSTNDASAGGTTDTDGKSSDGKERSPMKKSKGSIGGLGMLSKSSGEAAAKSGSANGVVSQSGESGSEGSSDGSDEDGEKRNGDHMNTEGNAGQPGYGAQGGSAFVSPGAGGKAAVGTNLNMGMDYWAGQPGNQSSGKGKRGAQSMVPPMPGGQILPHSRDGVPSELWIQDERELKRQRRKQSNRESARRSRLRKQAECEELAQRVETLTMENMTLRQELEQALEERNKLAADNAALLEQLQKGGRGSESTNNNNTSNNNNNEVDAHHQNSTTTTTSSDVNMVERNGRVEGENCETVGKAAIEAASRGEAVAAAG